eukprot:8322069-Prorocentrum_lima.AAC.1
MGRLHMWWTCGCPHMLHTMSIVCRCRNSGAESGGKSPPAKSRKMWDAAVNDVACFRMDHS